MTFIGYLNVKKVDHSLGVNCARVCLHVYPFLFENSIEFDMDPVIRELVIKHIDNFLNEEKLLEKVSIFKECQKRGLVSSIENALYGALIESLYDITIVLNVFEGYTLTSDELQELLDVVQKNSIKIKSKISRVSTS